MNPAEGKTKLDPYCIREDFPILQREIRPGIPLIYLDSTATAQKPNQVIDAVCHYSQKTNANIHRGIYTLSEESTALYESARGKIAHFIHARSPKEVIFTRNTTESINLVSQTWGRANLKSGDRIILTEMEHHSNLVPWQILAGQLGFILEFIPVSRSGELDLQVYKELLEKKPRLVAFTHMSNVLGTINPAKEIIRLAHDAGALALVDAAQSVPHFKVNVEELDVDFMAFSAHKMCGPSGVGVLYGREKLLDAMPPFLGGGDMIKQVSLRTFETNELPQKFEAGTPAIEAAIGFGAAVDYLNAVGLDSIADHEHALIDYAIERLEEIPGLSIFGPDSSKKGGIASFTLNNIHPHDVADILNESGIAVRAGHHCAMPLHEKFQIPATTRASFYLYNTIEEIDQLVTGLYKVINLFN